MARSSSYTYDPATGKWNQNTSTTNSDKTNTPAPQSNNSGSNLTSSTSDKNNSTGSVEKKYNTIEMNTLSGTLNYIATEKTIKLRAGDTVKIQGIGKHLSGDYYVQEVVRKIDSSGYTHNATVIKTDFGSSLKVKTEVTETTSTETETTQPSVEEKEVASTPQASTAQRTYTVVAGDSLSKIAKQFYNDASQWKKIQDANTGQIANPDLIYVGQVLVIP